MNTRIYHLIRTGKVKEVISLWQWMISDLELTGYRLHVFAIIYNLTEDGTARCDLSLNDFMALTGVGKTSIVAILKELTASGLIIKNDINYTAGGVNEYWANLQEIQKRISKKGKCKNKIIKI